MKLTSQMPSSTSFMPSVCPAMTVDRLIFFRCMQMRPHSALGYLSPSEFLTKTTAPALETLAVSALSLNSQTQPENSRTNRP